MACSPILTLLREDQNFHWHVSGPHFRSYHLLFDEQSEGDFRHDRRTRRTRTQIGGTTIRSIAISGKLQSVKDNEQEFVAPLDMCAS